MIVCPYATLPQLLFTVLEKAEEPVIRANLIVALGDLSCRCHAHTTLLLILMSLPRFPNTVEPWTPKMYARLHDSVTRVRSNTLTVLAHLILNDMIKVGRAASSTIHASTPAPTLLLILCYYSC